MKSILDPSFRYVGSHATDLRKTFARVRREQALAQSSGPPKRNEQVMRLRVVRKRFA